MRFEKPQEHSTVEETQQSLASRRGLLGIVYVTSLIALFCLGCFVVGPTLSRMRPAKVVDVQAPPGIASLPTSEPPIINRKTDKHPKVTAQIDETPDAATEPDKSSEKASSPTSESASSARDASKESDLPGSASEPVAVQPDAPPIETDEPRTSNAADAPIHRVRAGIFADRANADVLAEKLVAAGFAPAVYQVQHNSKFMFSVQLGAFRRRESADQLANSLKQAGFEAVVTTDK